MRTKPTNSKATKMVKDIRRANRKLYSAEEKIRIVLEGLRAATTDEVKDLRREARDLKEVVAEQTLELRLLKKSMIGDGVDDE